MHVNKEGKWPDMLMNVSSDSSRKQRLQQVKPEVQRMEGGAINKFLKKSFRVECERDCTDIWFISHFLSWRYRSKKNHPSWSHGKNKNTAQISPCCFIWIILFHNFVCWEMYSIFVSYEWRCEGSVVSLAWAWAKGTSYKNQPQWVLQLGPAVNWHYAHSISG